MWSDLDALVDQDDDEHAVPAPCSDSDSEWSDLDALVDQDDDEDAAPALCSDSDSDLGDELQVQDVRTVRTVAVTDLVEFIAPGLAVVAQPKITLGKPSQRAKDDLDALVDQDDDEHAVPSSSSSSSAASLCSDSDLDDEQQVQDVRTVAVTDLVEFIAPGLAVAVVAQPKMTFGKPSQRTKEQSWALCCLMREKRARVQAKRHSQRMAEKVEQFADSLSKSGGYRADTEIVAVTSDKMFGVSLVSKRTAGRSGKMSRRVLTWRGMQAIAFGTSHNRTALAQRHNVSVSSIVRVLDSTAHIFMFCQSKAMEALLQLVRERFASCPSSHRDEAGCAGRARRVLPGLPLELNCSTICSVRLACQNHCQPRRRFWTDNVRKCLARQL